MAKTAKSHSPIVLPKTEEELDRIKCAQRSEQDQQWDQMSEEERKKLRERLFSADDTELEPLVGFKLE
jgi:hypothetical protein